MRHLIVILFAALSLAAHAEPTLKLAEVSRFDTNAIGYAASASPNYEAFRRALGQGEAAAPLFAELLKTGTPAAKLYSAIALYHLDQKRGVQALESLSDSSETVSSLMGCLMNQSTVGEIAKGLLKDGQAGVRAYLPH